MDWRAGVRLSHAHKSKGDASVRDSVVSASTASQMDETCRAIVEFDRQRMRRRPPRRYMQSTRMRNRSFMQRAPMGATTPNKKPKPMKARVCIARRRSWLTA